MDASNLQTLAGRAGRILLAIDHSPCRGVLSQFIVTRPLCLHLQGHGIDARAGGAYLKRGWLFCRIEVADVGQAIPALIEYLELIGLNLYTRVGYQFENELERHDLNPEPRRSYLAADRWTMGEYIETWWRRSRLSPMVDRVRLWWWSRVNLGDLSRAFFALAIPAVSVAALGYIANDVALAAWGTIASGVAFALAQVTRPQLPRAVVEEFIAGGVRSLQHGVDDLPERLAKIKSHLDQGGHE